MESIPMKTKTDVPRAFSGDARRPSILSPGQTVNQTVGICKPQKEGGELSLATQRLAWKTELSGTAKERPLGTDGMNARFFMFGEAGCKNKESQIKHSITLIFNKLLYLFPTHINAQMTHRKPKEAPIPALNLLSDRPGYSCERTQWVLVTGAEPLNSWPACVLRRLSFDGMKPTFRHGRPEMKMHKQIPESNRKRHFAPSHLIGCSMLDVGCWMFPNSAFHL